MLEVEAALYESIACELDAIEAEAQAYVAAMMEDADAQAQAHQRGEGGWVGRGIGAADGGEEGAGRGAGGKAPACAWVGGRARGWVDKCSGAWGACGS